MIYDKLYDWQKKIVDEFSWRHRFGLFLDMGLGKTPISLALAERNKCTKIIVITINAKVYEPAEREGSWLYWADQAAIKYTHSIKDDIHAADDQPDILLINYESLFTRAKTKKTKIELRDTLIDFVNTCVSHHVAIIIDESHKMKDLHSMQTMAIQRLVQVLRSFARELYIYLLSGTPFTTGYIDLYSQLKMLGYDQTKNQFVENFCVRGNLPGLLGYQQPIVGYKNINSLFETIHEYAITINSDKVIDLPEQIFIPHKLKSSFAFNAFTSEKLCGEAIHDYFSGKVSEELILKYKVPSKINNPLYRDIEYDITKEYGASKWYAETTGTFWLRARQLSIGFIGNAEESKWYNKDRLDHLKELLEQNEDNYVLFYNFTPEMLELYDLCNELGYNVDVYCGEIKSLIFYDKYCSQTSAEQLTNKKNIILANFASGSTGMNWQAYNKCIIFSLPVYKDWAQGIKRIHRTGQKNTTFYHIFYQENWLDEGMKKALETGTEYSKEMFESDLNRVNEIMEENK